MKLYLPQVLFCLSYKPVLSTKQNHKLGTTQFYKAATTFTEFYIFPKLYLYLIVLFLKVKIGWKMPINADFWFRPPKKF